MQKLFLQVTLLQRNLFFKGKGIIIRKVNTQVDSIFWN